MDPPDDVDIEELLGRPEIQLDPEHVRGYLVGRVVLVTGAVAPSGRSFVARSDVVGPAS